MEESTTAADWRKHFPETKDIHRKRLNKKFRFAQGVKVLNLIQERNISCFMNMKET
jgi:hypothetical protein